MRQDQAMKKRINPWNDVLMHYVRTKKVPKCPVCDGEKLKLEESVHENIVRSMWFICEDCHAWSGFYRCERPAEGDGAKG